MQLRLGEFLSLLCASAALAGCTTGADVVRSAELWTRGQGDGVRHFLETEWDTAWVKGGSEDTLLANPSVIRAGATGLYVLDRSLQQVTALDSLGDAVWSYGSRGSGPNEFQNPRDMRVDGQQRILVYDPGNMRVVALSQTGEPISRIPLVDVTVGDQMFPISESSFLIATYGREQPMVAFDWSGNVVARLDLPWREFAELSAIARQGLLFGQGESWGYGFSMGNGWFGYEGLSARADTGRYIEHTPFPTLVQNSSGDTRVTRMAQVENCSACTMVLDEGTLYVHFGGETEMQQRLVDTYEWQSGAYLGTILLPHWAETLDVRGKRFYLSFSNPYPQLLALDLREDPEIP